MPRYETRSRTRQREERQRRSSRNSRSRDRESRHDRRNTEGRRDIDRMFNEFRDVFDPDFSDALSIRAHSDLDETNSTHHRDRDLVNRRSNGRGEDLAGDAEMPAWAQSLINSQEKAISELRSEIRSLKRKRDDDKENDFDWKKKGNKKQYEFNKSVEEQLEEIGVSNTLLEARSIAEKGLSLITERNKLIKIADKHGWDTVNNYVSDPLAKDDADDKKLRKAVKDAEKTREKSRREREAKSRRVARARVFGNNGSALNPSRLGPLPSTSTDTASRVVVTSDKKYSQLRCYRCGKVGHVSRDCVAPMTETNSK